MISKSGMLLVRPGEKFHFDTLSETYAFERMEFLMTVEMVTICPDVQSLDTVVKSAASYRCPGGAGAYACDAHFGGFSEKYKRTFTEASEFWSATSPRGFMTDHGCWGLGEINNCLALTPKNNVREMAVWKRQGMACVVVMNGKVYKSGDQLTLAVSQMENLGTIVMVVNFECPVSVLPEGEHFLGAADSIYLETFAKAETYAISGCPLYKTAYNKVWQFVRPLWNVRLISAGRFSFGAKWSGGLYGRPTPISLDASTKTRGYVRLPLSVLTVSYVLTYPSCLGGQVYEDFKLLGNCTLKNVKFEGYQHSTLGGGDSPVLFVEIWAFPDGIGKADIQCAILVQDANGTRTNLIAMVGKTFHAVMLQPGVHSFWTPDGRGNFSLFIPVETLDNQYDSSEETVGTPMGNSTGIDLSGLGNIFSGLMEYLVPILFVIVGAMMFQTFPIGSIVLIGIGLALLLPKVLGIPMIQPVIGPSMFDHERLFHLINFGHLVSRWFSGIPVPFGFGRLLTAIVRLIMLNKYWHLLSRVECAFWAAEYVCTSILGWYWCWFDYFGFVIVAHQIILSCGFEWIDDKIDDFLQAIECMIDELDVPNLILYKETNPGRVWKGITWNEVKSLFLSITEDLRDFAGEHSSAGPTLFHWSEVADMDFFSNCVYPVSFQEELSSALDHMLVNDDSVDDIIEQLGIEDMHVRAWLHDLEVAYSRL